MPLNKVSKREIDSGQHKRNFLNFSVKGKSSLDTEGKLCFEKLFKLDFETGRQKNDFLYNKM